MSITDRTLHFGSCSACPIRKQAVCAHCGREELRQLDTMKYYRNFEAGQPIVWSGDRMNFVASIVSGVASLTQSMEDGRTQIVGLLLPSDFVGRPGREFAEYNVTAKTDLVMCCFHKKPFEEMVRSTPAIAQRLLEMTLDELDAARAWMLLLGRKTAREKIASLLVIIAQRTLKLEGANSRANLEFDLPLTREAMADYLGLTIETVSRQISMLKKANVILLEGTRRIRVPDFPRLMVEAGSGASV
ncbi:transcriptional regulator FnrL [Falsihalocynthiibacter sp. SS001]|uniref:transcriptional regulator FnrL n=1 Tax=Falsihalocynthiibacter sp. SS001 TaxID=3349698 RepID=UPI0036D3BB39